MKSNFIKSIFAILFLFLNFAAFAQPSNDQPCDAILLTVDGDATGVDNSTATADPSEVTPPFIAGAGSCVGAWCNDENIVQNSVWFSFVAPANGAVSITTCLDTNTIDTQIAVWQATDCADYSTFNFLAANDDTPNPCSLSNQYSSYVQVDNLLPGETYYIQLDGFQGDSGIAGILVSSALPTSYVNFIQNSADLANASVDIRVNDELVAENFAFRTCSGFLPITAGIESIITVHPAGAAADTEPLCSLTQTFDATQDYLITLAGISSTTGYTPTFPAQLYVFEGAKQYSSAAEILPIVLFHGTTDAPILDVINGETSSLINNNIGYGSYSYEGYVQIDATNFTIQLTDENGNDIGLNFCAPLALIGQFSAAFTIVASGFVNPTNNSNGPELGLFVVNHFDGTFFPLEAGACQFPSNDDLCDALTLVVNDPPTSVDNTFATVQEGESSPNNLPGSDPESDCVSAWCDGSLDNTLWFKFVAPTSGSVSISTCFINAIDSQVSLCTVGDCNDFSSVNYILSNDDMVGGCDVGDQYASYILAENLTPGNIYHVQVDGYQNAAGPYDIQVLSVEVGVGENYGANIRMFPNPASETISFSGLNGASVVQLFDASGRQVLSKKTNNNASISLENIPAGVYSVKINSNDGLVSRMLVVQ